MATNVKKRSSGKRSTRPTEEIPVRYIIFTRRYLEWGLSEGPGSSVLEADLAESLRAVLKADLTRDYVSADLDDDNVRCGLAALAVAQLAATGIAPRWVGTARDIKGAIVAYERVLFGD
jgi:hypothetical protein